VPVFGPDADLGRNQHRIAVAAPVAFLHPGNNLALHVHHSRGRELSACALVATSRNSPGLDPALELLPDAGISGFSHAACQALIRESRGCPALPISQKHGPAPTSPPGARHSRVLAFVADRVFVPERPLDLPGSRTARPTLDASATLLPVTAVALLSRV
jgi:hypothetical protein